MSGLMDSTLPNDSDLDQLKAMLTRAGVGFTVTPVPYRSEDRVLRILTATGFADIIPEFYFDRWGQLGITNVGKRRTAVMLWAESL